ncbi:hypothetical protein GCM10028805_19820 [Spirosoma harenae]
MKLSWTFYPKGEPASITLTVIYIPDLDTENLPGGGFLHPETNTAFVDWATYKRFDSTDVAGRKDAFQQLTPINDISASQLQKHRQ